MGEKGIQISQFKRKLYFLPWSAVRTVGISFGPRVIADVFVSALTPLEITKLTEGTEGTECGAICRRYAINYEVWKRNGTDHVRDKPLVIVLKGCSRTKKYEDVLRRIQQYQYEYIRENGGVPICILRFPKP